MWNAHKLRVISLHTAIKQPQVEKISTELRDLRSAVRAFRKICYPFFEVKRMWKYKLSQLNLLELFSAKPASTLFRLLVKSLCANYVKSWYFIWHRHFYEHSFLKGGIVLQLFCRYFIFLINMQLVLFKQSRIISSQPN